MLITNTFSSQTVSPHNRSRRIHLDTSIHSLLSKSPWNKTLHSDMDWKRTNHLELHKRDLKHGNEKRAKKESSAFIGIWKQSNWVWSSFSEKTKACSPYLPRRIKANQFVIDRFQTGFGLHLRARSFKIMGAWDESFSEIPFVSWNRLIITIWF